jgi:hypothetical protein
MKCAVVIEVRSKVSYECLNTVLVPVLETVPPDVEKQPDTRA